MTALVTFSCCYNKNTMSHRRVCFGLWFQRGVIMTQQQAARVGSWLATFHSTQEAETTARRGKVYKLSRSTPPPVLYFFQQVSVTFPNSTAGQDWVFKYISFRYSTDKPHVIWKAWSIIFYLFTEKLPISVNNSESSIFKGIKHNALREWNL